MVETKQRTRMSKVKDSDTLEQIERVVTECRHLFVSKLKDYGSAWRIMRPESLTDQIYIKASRIRTIQMNGMTSRVNEGIQSEFVGIVNYGLIAMLQLRLPVVDQPDMTEEDALGLYDSALKRTLALLKDKNHDYGEAWRKMRVGSITDLILTKVYRTKQIEDNDGLTLVSEGIEANYMDMVNYAIFALILLHESGSNA